MHARLARLRSGWWALVPLASIVLVVAAIDAAANVADGLTYLALATTPPLAVAALALAGGVRAALIVVPLFALAWAAHGSLAGDAAAVALTALGCASLGVMLTIVAPARLLKLGVVAMAAADTTLVVVQLLQRPDARLNAAAPALGLPQFQRASFGDAVMGYGDLFLAGVLGALLALEHRDQRLGAALTAVLAGIFGLLFFAVHVLPATVPVAAAMVVLELRARRPASAGRSVRTRRTARESVRLRKSRR